MQNNEIDKAIEYMKIKSMKINIFVNNCDNSFYALHIATPGSGSPSEESQHDFNAVSK